MSSHPSTPFPPPGGLSPGRVVALLAVAALAACVAPREGYQGSAAEFGAMVAEGGAQPVTGEVRDGEAEPMGESLADPPPELAAAIVEQLQADAGPPDTPDVSELNPYVRFGERAEVHVHPDGNIFVTKPYFLPTKKGEKILALIGALEPFPIGPRPPAVEVEGSPGVFQRGAHDPQVVYWEELVGWDSENYVTLGGDALVLPSEVIIGDLFVVTAIPELLERFETFIDLYGHVPQIELEAKIIEIVETDTTDIGIKPVSGLPIFEFGSMNFISAFDFNMANTEGITEGLLTLGALQDGVTFNAIIEAVQSWQNVSVESKPKTVVRAGGTATLSSIKEIPYMQVKNITTDGNWQTVLAIMSVGPRLMICPRLVGANTLALDIQLEVSQQVGYQDFVVGTGAGTIGAPIIAKRSARTHVTMEPGQTLLIGGLTIDRLQQVQSKVPIVGDIPLIGMFFRNKLDVREKEHVIFAISPRIVQRGDFDIDF